VTPELNVKGLLLFFHRFVAVLLAVPAIIDNTVFRLQLAALPPNRRGLESAFVISSNHPRLGSGPRLNEILFSICFEISECP
jgi:hypothetical protein